MTSSISTKSWIYLLVVSFIWGSSFILMKKGLVAFSPFQVACMRIFFSMLALFPFILYLKKLKKEQFWAIAGVAFLGSGIPPFLFTTAQTQITSAATSIINSLTPLFALIVGVIFFHMLFSWRKLFGVLLGLIGATLLILLSTPLEAGGNNWYGILVVLASLCYALSANFIKTYCQNIPPIALNVGVFFMIGPLAGIGLFSTDFISVLVHQPDAWIALAYVLILAVFGTAFASILFFKLTQETDALFASTTTYLIPIFAIGWGFLDDEVIGWEYAIGLGLILAGVYLASRK